MWLWGWLTAQGGPPAGSLHGQGGSVPLAELVHRSVLHGRLEELRGRNVVLRMQDQLTAALALIELDGVARRMVICSADLASDHLAGVVRDSQAEVLLRDAAAAVPPLTSVEIFDSGELQPAVVQRRQSHETEWVLLTSGTTGAPKLVQHSLTTLTSTFAQAPPPQGTVRWSTFYDIRRYGGMQIFLRALQAGSLVLSGYDEPVTDFLARVAAAGVTHMSGTPSHWRRALMSGAAARISPAYVRLSGEIADQGILDNLKTTYPQSHVAHAFASTEAGVAFEVMDGLTGFPESCVGVREGREIRVSGGTLEIRSQGTAFRYLGENAPQLKGADGFVDTGDRLEVRAGRYHFMGRSGGVINVGGLKVHPEEIEAVINSHPWVHMSLVRARRNPITGAVVVAEVVLEGEADGIPQPQPQVLIEDIMAMCRQKLASHKVPATVRIVPSLEVSAAGKLVRTNA
jgi:acyl-coenzyme A synthetase/AMP-(fatty) acid ligase